MKKYILLLIALVMVACGENGVSAPSMNEEIVDPTMIETPIENTCTGDCWYMETGNFTTTIDYKSIPNETNPINTFAMFMGNSTVTNKQVVNCGKLSEIDNILMYLTSDYGTIVNKIQNSANTYGAGFNFYKDFNDNNGYIYLERCNDGMGNH